MENIINNANNVLHPYWITGFIDAEGCFTVKFYRKDSCKTGWSIQPYFLINLHTRDINLLLQIKSFFNNVGTITRSKDKDIISYRVYNSKDINNIIFPHFDKYTLITQKQNDYFVWRKITKLINEGNHLSKNGLIEILNLRALLNKGLSESFINYFPKTVKIKAPAIKSFSKTNINYSWFAGFFSGKGCFFIDIFKSKTSRLNYSVRLKVIIGQHSKDELLISNLISSLNCGTVAKHVNRKFITYTVNKFEHIYSIIIPLFNQHKIEGIKYLDFKDFSEAAKLIKNKAHLTQEGLDKIRSIKSRMNLKRY